jgi:hypothetical protein
MADQADRSLYGKKRTDHSRDRPGVRGLHLAVYGDRYPMTPCRAGPADREIRGASFIQEGWRNAGPGFLRHSLRTPSLGIMSYQGTRGGSVKFRS